jgi:2-polyprenyl-3-methyl-5-hydroxy-6-metoxy-1,4-benzoquinol methylase
MHRRLLDALACPACRGDLDLIGAGLDGDRVLSGTLVCRGCAEGYKIVDQIPRFVSSENYAQSFGFQWNLFKLEQFDSVSGTTLSRDRFFSETGWVPSWLEGKLVLDAGCGAGRFLDVATRTGATVIGVDLSDAVDAAASTLADRGNLDLVQARIDALPFRDGVFDGIYCIGVLQHTSDPEACARALGRALRPGGRIAITAYERRRWTMLYSKYWVRRAVGRLSPDTLYRLVSGLMPLLFPLTEILFRLPLIGRAFRFLIPVANYVDLHLSLRQRYRWALLDTFDMLAPAYDRPQRYEDLRHWLEAEAVTEIDRLPNPGLSIVGRKAAHGS